ncbi:hypothetical protein [Streptomyces sp. NPDC048172]|uniref:hypothetical protein n=1 Tax=Streptomyces sp. NPDC048172 TaxID=3365505 RepID=UPI0037225184
MAGAVVAGVLALSLLTAGILFLAGGDGEGRAVSDAPVDGSSSAGAAPGGGGASGPDATPTGDPVPDDDGAATDFPDPDPSGALPTGDPGDGASDITLPSFLLRKGACYDLSGKREGQVETRDCAAAHDAEVVARKRIQGSFEKDAAVAEKAESLCRPVLRTTAKRQPGGTVGGTLVSYPKAEGVNAGLDRVTCSLTAGKGKKLHKPLR